MLTLRPVGLLAFSLVSIAFSGCGPEAKFRNTERLSVASQADASIEVTSRNGAVNIEADAGADVRIVADVRALTQERADAVRIRAERSADGALVVAALWPDDIQHNSEACSFDIRLPGARGAGVRTTNGAVRLVGLGGSATIATSNGAVTIQRQDGDVRVQTSNGSITVTDAAGAIDLSTSNGQVRVTGARAHVACVASNGAVSVAMAPDASGPANLATSNAAIELSVGRGFKGTILALTSNGKVRFSPSLRSGSEPSGRTESSVEITPEGPTSELRTSNGSITVVREE